MSNVQVWQEWPAEIVEAADAAAYDVFRRFPQHVELEDMRQEAQLYIATHAKIIGDRVYSPTFVRKHVRDRLTRMAVRAVAKATWPLPEAGE